MVHVPTLTGLLPPLLLPSVLLPLPLPLLPVLPVLPVLVVPQQLPLLVGEPDAAGCCSTAAAGTLPLQAGVI